MKNATCLNDTMRRSDRAMDEEGASALLKSGEYGTLGMIEEGGAPYLVQVNYVWDGGNAIYIHSATAGRKVDCLRREGRVCFSITGGNRVLSSRFSEAYESVLLRGTAHEVADGEEKLKALRMLIDKYSPSFRERGYSYAQKAGPKTLVFRIDVALWSAKRRVAPK
ncbi:MAG: pyridoxamine 5'-phosphate oxidase family protein, partial [Succinivibrio sp.]